MEKFNVHAYMVTVQFPDFAPPIDKLEISQQKFHKQKLLV